MNRGDGWRSGALGWVALVLAASPLWGAPKTDVVVLRNGDHLTGEVQQLERGYLRLKTDDMGTLEIEWDKVRSVTASALFDVDDLHGGRYVGSLAPGAEAGKLTIVAADGDQAVDLLSLVRMRRLDKSLWKRLDGSIDLGASYTSASELFKLDFAGNISTERPGYEIRADANATLSSQTGVEDTQRSSFSLAYERRFEGRWVALARGELERNRELGFDLRGSSAAGGGRYLVQDRNDKLMAAVGISANREVPIEGETTTNVEALAALTYDRFAYDFPKVDISVTLVGFASLNHGGRYRVEADASLKRELVKDFYATLRGYESYDSRPATEGAPTSDYGATFALGWSF
jgi:uncharacterized protein DUF481